METTLEHEKHPTPWSLIWIDADETIIVGWQAGGPRLDRIVSSVPAHRRSTGHIRFDPRVRHGGGAGQAKIEAHRREHLRRYLRDVAARLPIHDLEIIGPGTVREHLASLLRRQDRRAGRHRQVTCRPSMPLSEPQLVARLRELLELQPRRVLAPQGRATPLEPVE
jgi:hypothetical protein